MKYSNNKISTVEFQKNDLKVEAVKSALIRKFSEEYPDLETHLVRQAVVDADALTSLTFAPLLLLPTLAEEKVQAAAAWSLHQRSLRRNSRFALAA